jgi:hypothetical protein
MAWKRSSVRSRSGPPNTSFVSKYLAAFAVGLLRARGCGRVLNFAGPRAASIPRPLGLLRALLVDHAGVTKTVPADMLPDNSDPR